MKTTAVQQSILCLYCDLFKACVLGDFPKVEEMRKKLKLADFSKLRGMSDSMIKKV